MHDLITHLPLNGSTMLATLLASLVEFVEALTIVLAVNAVQGARTAALGALAGCLVLAALLTLGAPVLGFLRLHLQIFQLVAGALLVGFGWRWLRKAVLRAAGRLPLHDEARAFEKEVAALSQGGRKIAGGVDYVGFITACNGVLVEGLEVAFLVLSFGATSADRFVAASVGAGLALLVVALVGLALRQPLTRVPENALKFTVGVMVCGIGTLWIGEGVGVRWPAQDWASIWLALIYLIAAFFAVWIVRRAAKLSTP